MPDVQVKNTIDDIMWETVQHKLTNVGKVLDGKEDSLTVSMLHHFAAATLLKWLCCSNDAASLPCQHCWNRP